MGTALKIFVNYGAKKEQILSMTPGSNCCDCTDFCKEEAREKFEAQLEEKQKTLEKQRNSRPPLEEKEIYITEVLGGCVQRCIGLGILSSLATAYWRNKAEGARFCPGPHGPKRAGLFGAIVGVYLCGSELKRRQFVAKYATFEREVDHPQPSNGNCRKK